MKWVKFRIKTVTEPEDLPASEDIKKLERRVKREEKKLAEQSGKLTNE
jgi:DNA-damage-inducible protein D